MAEVHVSHLFKLDSLGVITINGESLTLSVEGVDHILVRIVETLVWEILGGALHLSGVEISLDGLLGVVIDEVIMGQIMIVEQLHENSVIVNERAGAEWISEALDWHGVVIDANG